MLLINFLLVENVTCSERHVLVVFLYSDDTSNIVTTAVNFSVSRFEQLLCA